MTMADHEPMYVSDHATLYCGDALAILPSLPNGSVDAVITDPPYSSGGQYRGDRTQPTQTKYVQTSSESRRALEDFTGDNRDQRGYAYWCVLWLGECLRIARPGAACVLFTDWRQLPVTSDILQSGGWVWRGIVPWHKPNGRNTQGRYANNCEYVVWGTAGGREPDASATLGGFFQVNTPRHRDHITQKPLAIMRELVKIVPIGGVVLDPFTGAGTTGVASLIEDRRFIGIELVAHHADTAANRLREAQLQPSARDEQPALNLADQAV